MTNVYDCSTDNMHFLRGEEGDFIEVEYVLSCTQTKSFVEGYPSPYENSFRPLAATVSLQRCANMFPCRLEDALQPFLYIQLFENRQDKT